MSGPPQATAKATQNTLVGIMDVVARLCTCVAGLLLVGIVIINGMNVFSRYVMSAGISWAEESMVFMMTASVFIGAIPVTWERVHIRIDALVQAFNGGARLAIECLAALITAAVLLPVGWLSFSVVLKLYRFDQRSDALDLPVWIPQATVPISLLLIPLVMALALTRGVGGPHDQAK